MDTFERDMAKKQLAMLKNINANIAFLGKELKRGKQIGELKETLEKVNADRTELQKDRDSYYDLYTQLSKAYEKLSDENRKLKARTDCLRTEVEWYRKHYKENSDKIQELKKELEELTSQYQKLTIENKRLQNSVRAGYDQGQTDLWVKLQNVKDMQPNEFDVECECLGDVIDMDLEDFLDAYKKWWEEKEKERLDHMRDYLDRFCRGRLCFGCPLESNKYKCGNGYSFRKFADNDLWIVPDEELERYYDKARGCGRCTLKNATYYFDNKPVTMTGTVEINADALSVILGIKDD